VCPWINYEYLPTSEIALQLQYLFVGKLIVLMVLAVSIIHCCCAGSDSDDDEAVSGYHEPLLEAKDPYALRPMPYLIGTGGFFSAEDVGISELPTDSEGV